MGMKTKRILNAIFALGLITATLSIGREVETTSWALEYDSACKLILLTRENTMLGKSP